MRCDASELCAGSCVNACSCAPVGGPPAADPPAATAAAIATPAISAAVALPKRRTRRFVEEVQVARVDRDRHVLAELQLDVRRERRDEVRARADDALLVLVARCERLVDGGMRFGPDLPRVHLEVRHRLAAERLD